MVWKKPFPLDSEPTFPYSNRGWHSVPASYHSWWVENRGAEIVEYMHQMHATHLLLITDGDSCCEEIRDPIDGKRKPVIAFLLDHHINPIIRDSTESLPKPWNNMATAERCVEIFANYGMAPMYQLWNEWFDTREGEMGDPNDDETWEKIGELWNSAATMLVQMGANPGFPDGPCFPRNPFPYLDRSIFDCGRGWYSGHFYGKGRPIDYPFDGVSRTGLPALTWPEYLAALGPYGDPNHPRHRQWMDIPVSAINSERVRLANPTPFAPNHPEFDATCFNGWQQIAAWSQETLGFVVPIALTEGGWCPRDKAGSGPDSDDRWPYTTPGEVANKTLAMWEADTPICAFTNWIGWDDYLCEIGYVGWPHDAAVSGWAYQEEYGYHKTGLIELLHENPPGTDPPPTPPDPPLPDPIPELWGAVADNFSQIRTILAKTL